MNQPTGQHCFAHSTGEEVYLFTLQNKKGTTVLITNYGAIITAFKIKQPDGTMIDIVLGFDNVEDYLSREYLAGCPYFGAAIGRYANRIANGQFSIDEKNYQVEINNGPNQLHGGKIGFDKKVWQYVSGAPDKLELTYLSEDGECGYPGNLQTTILFTLTDEDELVYEYSAATDKPTAVNLTHHSYFNLDNGFGTIGDQLVRIPASAVLEQDEHFVVTGNIVAVKGSRYDFRQLRRIDKDWNPDDGFDQTFILDLEPDPKEGLPMVAEAFCEKTNLKLEVFSSDPVVHFYTGKWIPPLPGKDGIVYAPFSGFCLETQIHPNAVNIPSFPNTILRPGETYRSKTMYKVTR